MDEDSKNNINCVQYKIISSLLRTNYEMQHLAYAKLFTAGKEVREWLYSELEGGLTIVIDYSRKSARFIMFDLMTYEIIFESELYKNFNKFYVKAKEKFQYFEISNGFVGFKFHDKESANAFYEIVSNLDEKKIEKALKNQKPLPSQDMKIKSKRILTLLMHKLSEEYLFKESGIVDTTIEFNLPQIERLLNLLSFDRQNYSFNIKGSSDEIDDLVDKVHSIKQIHHYINDLEVYTKELLKSVINSKKHFFKKNSLNKEELKKLQENKKKEEKRLAELKKAEEKRLEDEKKAAEKKRLQEEKDNKNKPKSVVPPVPQFKSVVPAVPQISGVPKVPTVPTVPKVPAVPIVPKVPAIPSVPKVPAVPTVPNVLGGPNIPSVTLVPNVTAQSTVSGNESNTHNETINTESTESSTKVAEEEKKIPEASIPLKKQPKLTPMDELKIKMKEREDRKNGLLPPLELKPLPSVIVSKKPNNKIIIPTLKPVNKKEDSTPLNVKSEETPSVKTEDKPSVKTEDKPSVNTEDKPSVNADTTTSSILSAPEKTISSETPKVHSIPGVPKVPGIPSTPGIIPSTPGVPRITSTPGVPGVPKIPGIPGISKAPGVPGIPTVPNVPKMPLNVPKIDSTPEVSHLNEITTLADTNPGLMSQIAAGGFKLKKITTVDKGGIDYLKKKNSIKPTPGETKNTGGGGQKTGDFMSEMKRKMEGMMKK